MEYSRTLCPDCNGAGTLYVGGDATAHTWLCPTCIGLGYLQSRFTVDHDAQTEKNQQKGQGDKSSGHSSS
jgi:DnaJ-class molecular chaperone